jgi:hypothetical protein
MTYPVILIKDIKIKLGQQTLKNTSEGYELFSRLA